jgi:hypothetical protein
MSQTSCLVRPSLEVSTNWSCSPSPTTKCIVLRWQLMQSRNPAAARISRRLAPPATTILPHHLLCDSFRKVSARKRPTLCRMASLQADGSGRLTLVRCVRHLFSGSSPTVYAGQSFNHRESGGTADAPDLGSGARKGVGVRLSPLAPLTGQFPRRPRRHPCFDPACCHFAATQPRTPTRSPWPAFKSDRRISAASGGQSASSSNDASS